MYLENGPGDLPIHGGFLIFAFTSNVQSPSCVHSVFMNSAYKLTCHIQAPLPSYEIAQAEFVSGSHVCLRFDTSFPIAFLEPTHSPVFIFLYDEAVPSTVSPVHSSSFSIAVREVTNNTPSHTRLANLQ